MFAVFKKELPVSCLMFLFLVCSILGKIMLGILYQNMIKETENMRATNHKLLKQCKLKFANCYRLNNGVSNIAVFVDKFLNQIKIGSVFAQTFYHLCGQMMLVSVVFSGIGICRVISSGAGFFSVLPFYIVSFFGLYLHFAVSAIVDIKGRRRILRVNLIDYLENHMARELNREERQVVQEKENIPDENQAFVMADVERQSDNNHRKAFSKPEEKELEALLKEFLSLS